MSNLFQADQPKPTKTAEKVAAPDLTPVETVSPPAVIEAERSEEPPALYAMRPMSFKDGVSLLPVDQQKLALVQYDERRRFFLRWLLAHLKQGVHYGVAPGCEARGNPDPEQWTAKPGLYKAGALLIIDLLRLRAVCEADEALWKQMGSVPGKIVMRCRLIDPATGAIVGEGVGAFVVGEKKMAENSSLKMCEKRATVDAVIQSIPVVADLFTQDMNDPEDAPPPKENPAADQSQPITPPRAERVVIPNGPVSAEVGALYKAWLSKKGLHHTIANKQIFMDWASKSCGGPVPANSHEWTIDMLTACSDAMKEGKT